MCPKIADFGLSNFNEKCGKESMNLHSNLRRIGTPSYISPEIWTDICYSKKSDVYAFAFILYEIFVGENLFLSMVKDWDSMKIYLRITKISLKDA